MSIAAKINRITNSEAALNAAWQLFERVVGLGCSFIASVFVIRYFAPADYGVFAYASSYVTLFSSLTTLGLQSIAVREMVKQKTATEVIMGSSFIIMLIGSLIALILAVSGAILSHEKSTVTLVVLIYCLVNIVSSLSVINYYFQAQLKTRYIAYVMLVQDIIDISIRLCMVHFKAQLLSFAVLGLVESIIANLIIFIIFKNFSKLAKWKLNLKIIKYLLHQSIPLALAGAMVSLYMRLDQVMIEYFCGLKAVAEYSVGVKLIEIFYMLPVIIVPNIFPLIIKAHERSIEEFEVKIMKVYKCSILVSLFLATLVSIFGGDLIHFLYGDKYKESELIFQVGIWCIVPVYLGVFSGLWTQTLELQKYSIFNTFCGLITCVILNFILIPLYGIIGAIIATIIAQFVASIFAQIFINKTRHNCFLIIHSVFN